MVSLSKKPFYKYLEQGYSHPPVSHLCNKSGFPLCWCLEVGLFSQSSGQEHAEQVFLVMPCHPAWALHGLRGGGQGVMRWEMSLD